MNFIMVGLEDWNNIAKFDEEHYVDTEHSVDEGGASLRIESLTKTEATIYQPSLNATSASSEGRIETSIRRTGNDVATYDEQLSYMALVLRYSDIDNYYCVTGNGRFPNGLVMYRTIDGETESINSVDFTSNSRFSDGTQVKGDSSWIPFRITWFVDGMGGFRIRIEEEADGDGSWEEVGGALVDPDPVLGPDDTETGSGVGFGGVDAGQGTGKQTAGVWYDQTKIYYETNN